MDVEHFHEIQRAFAICILVAAQRIHCLGSHAGITCAGDHRVRIGSLHGLGPVSHHLVKCIHRGCPTTPGRLGVGEQVRLVPHLVVLHQIEARLLVVGQQHIVGMLATAIASCHLEAELAVPRQVFGRKRQQHVFWRIGWGRAGPARCQEHVGQDTQSGIMVGLVYFIQVQAPRVHRAGKRILVRSARNKRPLTILEPHAANPQLTQLGRQVWRGGVQGDPRVAADQV